MKGIVTLANRCLDTHRNAAAIAIAALALLGVMAANIAAGYDSALRVLYVLPLWLAARLGGVKAGWVVVGLTTAVGTLFDCVLTGHSRPLWACLVLHFAAFSLIMLAISRLEESLWRARKLSMVDPLTGLLNRRALTEYADGAVTRAATFREPLTVVLVDCDDFKSINDSHGHEAGDHVLRILAKVLESATRQSDLVSRIGGDEFVIVFPGADSEETQRVMLRVETEFAERVRNAGYTSGLSIGIGQLKEEPTSFDALLAEADKEMYAAKAVRRRRAYLN